jgi:hypothetical protein
LGLFAAFECPLMRRCDELLFLALIEI